MGNKYSYEFNRSFPHQTEGPEISPYSNKTSPRKKISISAAAVLAVVAAVAVVAVALASPLGFYIDNVEPTVAELFFDAGGESGFLPEDEISYRMLCRGEEVKKDDIPHSEGSVLLLELEADTYYTVQILCNGEVLKTLDFRTPPLRTEQTAAPSEDTTNAPPSETTPPETTSPETTPPETTPPETTPPETTPPETEPPAVPPVISDVVFEQVEGTYNVTFSASIERNDAIIRAVQLLYKNIPYRMSASGGRYTGVLPNMSVGAHTCTIAVTYMLDGEEQTLTSEQTFTVVKNYRELVFSGLTATQNPLDRASTIKLDISANDSQIRSISVYENGKSVLQKRINHTLYVKELSVGKHELTVTVKYTTNGVDAEASRNVTLTVKEPPRDLEMVDSLVLEWQESLDFDGSLLLNDAKNVTAIFTDPNGNKLADVTIGDDGGNEAWLACSVENMPSLGNEEYAVYHIVFSYELGGVATTKSVDVLVSRYWAPATFFVSANPGTTEGAYDVWFSLGDVFIDAEITKIEIKLIDNDSWEVLRTAFSKTYSDLTFSGLYDLTASIELDSSETDITIEVAVTYELGGAEFTATEFCGIANH